MAPNDIKFAETPNNRIIAKEKSKHKGMTEATTKPARRFPKSKTNTKTTINPPSIKFFLTVPIALSISLLRSINDSIFTPSGNDFWISSTRFFTSTTTLLADSPFNKSTIPPTDSPSPLRLMAPKRTA